MNYRRYHEQDTALRQCMDSHPRLSREMCALLCGVDLADILDHAEFEAIIEAMERAGQMRLFDLAGAEIAPHEFVGYGMEVA